MDTMDVKARLENEIDRLFIDAGAPSSRAAYELREELLANSLDRYADLLTRGMGQEEAYNSMLGNIGNVEELVAALPQDPLDPAFRAEAEERRARNALVIALSVGMYIVIAVLVMAVSLFAPGLWSIGAVLLGLLLCVVPTCLLVFNAYRWPRYKKGDETVVESFKQFNSQSQRSRGIIGALSVMLWCLVLIVYFLVSFITFAWHLTWLIFLVGGCLQAALVLLVKVRHMK